MTNLSFRSHWAVILVCWTIRAETIPMKPKTMKLRHIICAVGVTSLLACGVVGCATEEQKEARLQAEAKVSRADAEKTALAKVPGGTIKEGELEKEKGKLIWSFDISTPGSSDIKEVQVDAITGQVVSIETETAKAEAKDKKKEKEEDEKDEKK
jgi:peptidase YpeB-like protein